MRRIAIGVVVLGSLAGAAWAVEAGPGPALGPGSGASAGPSATASTAPPGATAAPGPASRPGEPRPAARPDGGEVGPACRGRTLCAGAAKEPVTPLQRHVDGVVEPRLGVGTRLQRFHLGGFGINPLQSLPDPTGDLAAALTEPAGTRRYAGSHGPEDIWVRVLVLRQPGGPAVALVTLDAVGAGNVVQGRLTEVVAAAAGVAPRDVLVSATHTHAGPDLQGLWGGVPQDWLEAVLYPAAGRAAAAAAAAVEPVTLEVRQGPVPEHNRYRRPKRLDLDVDSDPLSTLLEARSRATGRPVAHLLQYSAHPVTVDEDVRAPHPDYVLGAVDHLEAAGGVALYVNGPIADASPAGERPGCAYPDDGAYGTVRCRGEGIAAAAAAFAPAPIDRPTLEVRHAEVALPVTNPLFLGAGALGAFNRYYDFLELPVADLPLIGPGAARGLLDLPQLTPVALAQVSRVTIGGAEHGLELVTIPGEATGTFGAGIRALARPGARVALLGLTHATFGYLLPEEEFSLVDLSGDPGFLLPYTPYEELVSLGPLTATLLRAGAYVPLFGAPAEAALPPVLTACLEDLERLPCAVAAVRGHLAYGLRELAEDLAP